jgi:hypothetical protein
MDVFRRLLSRTSEPASTPKK